MVWFVYPNNAAVESFRLTTFEHDLHQLMLDSPGGIIGNADMPGNLQCGNAVLHWVSRYIARNHIVIDKWVD